MNHQAVAVEVDRQTDGETDIQRDTETDPLIAAACRAVRPKSSTDLSCDDVITSSSTCRHPCEPYRQATCTASIPSAPRLSQTDRQTGHVHSQQSFSTTTVTDRQTDIQTYIQTGHVDSQHSFSTTTVTDRQTDRQTGHVDSQHSFSTTTCLLYTSPSPRD